MPKIKSNRAAGKRFTVLASGKIKRNKANRRHLLNGKPAKRKMGLRRPTLVSEASAKTVKKMLPYD